MLGLAGIYTSSRALGLVREVGIAYLFGTSLAADRLSAAFVVASLVSIVAGEAFYAGSVRWLGGARPEPATAVSEPHYASLLTVGRRAALVATGAFALVGPLVTLFVLGGEEGPLQAIVLSIALAPSVGASLLSACVNARLTLERRFMLLNAVQMLYSVGALVGIAVIIVLGSEVGPLLVAVGWSAGNVAAALVLYIRARPGPAPQRSISTSGLELLRMGLPIATAYSLVAIQGLTDRTVAARLGPGRVAALSYADRLFLLPVGFVIAALGPMVLGALVAQRQRQERGEAVALQQVRAVVASLVPLSLVFVAIAPHLVSFIFEAGSFGPRSRELTVAALDGLSVGISAVALSLVLFRVMQAISDLGEIVFVSLAAVMLNAVLSIAGGVWLGLYGVTLATSVVALIVVSIQTARLASELGVRWAGEVLKEALLPVAFCSGLSIAVVAANQHDLLSDAGRAVVLVATAAFAAAALAPRRRQPS